MSRYARTEERLEEVVIVAVMDSAVVVAVRISSLSPQQAIFLERERERRRDWVFEAGGL